jgi:hypothetical protein
MRFLAAAIGVTVLVLNGCGDGRPMRVPVSGRVLIDGRPLTYGFVQFRPAGSRVSAAKLDDQGHFTLKCFAEGDGAVPGSHTIVVMANEPISSTKALWHAPKKYADYRTSGLQQEIANSTYDLVVNLTWAGGQPFVEDEDTGAIEPYRPEIHKPRK